MDAALDAGSCARVTMLGLLASAWGRNAVEIIDGLFPLLREAQRRDASFRQYSWTMVRRGLGLPRKAAALFYVTATRSGLGNGIFKHSGDDWWTVPDNLDEILEEPSALAFLRRSVAAQASPTAARLPPEAPASTTGSAVVMQQPLPDPKKVFIIHGRNVDARNAVEQFVRSLGLEPLDFDQVSADLGGSPFVGQVVRQGMDLAKGIVALFTPDEFSALRPNFRG